MKKLKKGQVFKNWKEVCEWFDWKTTGGDTKKAYLKEFESLCEYHKEGNKFIIDKVFNKPKQIKDGRKTIDYDQYKIDKNNNNNTGVYIIVDKDNNCYIGSTTRGFRYRFYQHWENYNGNMKHTYSLLHDNNAEFRILHDMTGVDDVDLIRMVEDEFIQYYRSLPNYNVLNRTDNAYYKGSIFSEKKKKQQYINIKVNKDKYSEIINLLQDNGLLESCVIQ